MSDTPQVLLAHHLKALSSPLRKPLHGEEPLAAVWAMTMRQRSRLTPSGHLAVSSGTTQATEARQQALPSLPAASVASQPRRVRA